MNENKARFGIPLVVLILLGIVIIIIGIKVFISATTVNSSLTSDVSNSTSYVGTMTLSKYNQIETGMTYEEVVEFVGEEGIPQDTEESNTESYCWYGTNGTSVVGLVFLNGNLTSIALIGELED